MAQRSKLPAAGPEPQNRRVFTGVGTNMGDRAGNIIRALYELHVLDGVQIVQVSGLYNTEPVGNVEQDDFLNAVVELQTAYLPEELLKALQKIEQKMGRVRKTHWGPRIIDLDILCMGNVIMNTKSLTLPHPEIGKRCFVLAPFCELAPDYRLAGYQDTVQQLLTETPDRSKVELVMTSCQVLKKLKEVYL